MHALPPTPFLAEADAIVDAVHIFPAKLDIRRSVTDGTPPTTGVAEPRQRHRQQRPPWLILTATEHGCPQPAPNGKV
jgi:hypothetical protein